MNDEVKISRLQQYLPVLRKIAGWSALDLSRLLGVTRQTVVTLENSSSRKMSKIQYIAIRALLDAEAAQREEKDNDQVLKQVIAILIDEDVDEEQKEEIEEIKLEIIKTVEDTTESVGKRPGSAAIGLWSKRNIMKIAAATAMATFAPLVPLPFSSLILPLWIMKTLKKDGETGKTEDSHESVQQVEEDVLLEKEAMSFS